MFLKNELLYFVVYGFLIVRIKLQNFFKMSPYSFIRFSLKQTIALFSKNFILYPESFVYSMALE